MPRIRPVSLLALVVSLFTLFFRSLLPASAQPGPAAYDFKANYNKSMFSIPMRDGVKLYTIVYAPKDTSQKYPILMTRTPYGVRPYEPDAYWRPGGAWQKMVREGYIVVMQDVRGRFMSEGHFEEVRPEVARRSGDKRAVDESTDTYDTIDWLVKNVPNNSGRVGLWGISYPGFYAGAGGIDSHPALKAISPEAPVSDWFIGDDDHHNGALFLMDFVGFYNGFGQEREKDLPTTSYPPARPLGIADAYQFYLDLGPLRNIDARYWHNQVRHWNDVSQHPDYDAWWQARALPAHLKNVHCAVLTVGGWYDAEDLFGQFADFHAIEKLNPGIPNSLVIGPWPHGGWSGGDFERFGDEAFGMKTGAWYRDQLFKPFFDFYLKQKGAWKQPKATVFATGANQWWQFDQWPPREVKPTAFYFAANHELTTTPPGESGYDAYDSDPANPVPYIAERRGGRKNEYMNDDQRFAAARPDVLTYQTPPLTEDLTLTGSIRADLQVSTTGTDADFIVKVIDVLPDDASAPEPNPTGRNPAGAQRLVRAEVMRARYRESYSRPKAMSPGKITHVAFDLRDVCHTFLKGHRLMVQIQSSWFPLVDRNPQTYVNIYAAEEKDFRKATQRVYHTSRIVLPQLTTLPPALPIDPAYTSTAPAPPSR